MAATFTLTAIPCIPNKGEDQGQGHLESVTFIATDGGYSKKWTSTNIGTYAQDFAKIVPHGNAQMMLERLRRGHAVQFPDLFELNDVLHQFGGAGND